MSQRVDTQPGRKTERQLDKQLEDSFPASDPPSTSPVVAVGEPSAGESTGKGKKVEYGFALSSEEHPPLELVRQAQLAEQAGFSFVTISDHFHPWTSSQGNSPFVWGVLGGIAVSTSRIRVGTGVTCPIIRTHPAIIAQASATAALMFEGRFFLGLGTGEALNEHITGEPWPTPATRLEMLEEAIEIIERLWTGQTLNHSGVYYTVSEAKLFSHPETPPPIYVASASPASARVAGRLDGLVATSPDKEVMSEFTAAGGKNKPRYGQITVCWDDDERRAIETARRIWPATAFGWEVRGNVTTPEQFDDMSQYVPEDVIAKNIICGPDPQRIADQVRTFRQGGFDHIYFHQVGPRQEEFIRFFEKQLAPMLSGIS